VDILLVCNNSQSPLTNYLQEKVTFERSHDFARVWLDDTGKKRDRSRDGLFAKETEDTQHGETSVVDLSLESLGLGILGLVLGQLERIVEAVEGHGVGDVIEGGEFSWNTTTHVMGQSRGGSRDRSKFRVEFKESNESNDLELAGKWKSIPLFRRAERSGWVRGSIEGEGVREDKVRLNAVSDEGSHGNSSVLDFGMTQPSDCFFVTGSPESGTGEV